MRLKKPRFFCVGTLAGAAVLGMIGGIIPLAVVVVDDEATSIPVACTFTFGVTTKVDLLTVATTGACFLGRPGLRRSWLVPS